MKFLRIAEQVHHRPWFITPAAHGALARVLDSALAESSFTTRSAEDLTAELGALIPARRPLAIDAEGIASIHILGPLGKGLSRLEESCGATSFETIRADLAAAQAQGARGILLEIDSPGGTITGTPETAAAIARKTLPTVVYTEGDLCSAAYYLGAGANAIVASPSATVGSIGVYIPWMDTSARYEAAGVKPDPIVNTGGDLKAAGFGGRLSEAQRAHLQEQVDQDFDAFKGHILAHRAVPATAMRGQTLSGQAALAANLIDALGERDTALATLRTLLRR